MAQSASTQQYETRNILHAELAQIADNSPNDLRMVTLMTLVITSRVVYSADLSYLQLVQRVTKCLKYILNVLEMGEYYIDDQVDNFGSTSEREIFRTALRAHTKEMGKFLDIDMVGTIVHLRKVYESLLSYAEEIQNGPIPLWAIVLYHMNRDGSSMAYADYDVLKVVVKNLTEVADRVGVDILILGKMIITSVAHRSKPEAYPFVEKLNLVALDMMSLAAYFEIDDIVKQLLGDESDGMGQRRALYAISNACLSVATV